MADLLAVRRKATFMYRDEMFKPETQEEALKRIQIMKKNSFQNKKSSKIRRQSEIVSNNLQDQVSKMSQFFDEVDAKEDKVNKSLHMVHVKKYLRGGGLMKSSIDQGLMN